MFLTSLCWLPSAESIFLDVQVLHVSFLCSSRTPSGKHKSLLDPHLGMSDQPCSGSIHRPSGKSRQSPRCQAQPVPQASAQYPGEHKGFLGRVCLLAVGCKSWGGTWWMLGRCKGKAGHGCHGSEPGFGQEPQQKRPAWESSWWGEKEREQGLYKGIHCSLDISAWAGSLSVPWLVLEGASLCARTSHHVLWHTVDKILKLCFTWAHIHMHSCPIYLKRLLVIIVHWERLFCSVFPWMPRFHFGFAMEIITWATSRKCYGLVALCGFCCWLVRFCFFLGRRNTKKALCLESLACKYMYNISFRLGRSKWRPPVLFCLPPLHQCPGEGYSHSFLEIPGVPHVKRMGFPPLSEAGYDSWGTTRCLWAQEVFAYCTLSLPFCAPFFCF